jgi:hypothetical protein
MEENILVVVVEKGIVTEVHSPDANMKIIVVDEDNRRVCESFITEFGWPNTQFDDDRVEQLLG